jgi:uncharacterized protein YifE (UPF0438 family)
LFEKGKIMPRIEFLYPVTKDMDLKGKFQLKRFKFTESKLSPSEKELLRERGIVLHEFWDGTLNPITPKQKHFIEMCKGNAEPNNEEERVWLKYISMLENEKRLEATHREELKDSPKRKEYLQSRFK